MAGRRSVRVKQKARHGSDSSEIGVGTDEDANVQVPKASTSKVRGKQRAVVKTSGVRTTKKRKLGLISEMPLDVLYEVGPSSLIFHHESDRVYILYPQIFSFLAPRDLVRMSWTNKDFRRVLTSHPTKNIWKAALDSIDGLPPCPSHMNEIEYSTVLFHVACYVRPLVLIGDSLCVHDRVGVWESAASSELVLPKENLQTVFAGPVSLLEPPQVVH